jgi:hypothetical protein
MKGAGQRWGINRARRMARLRAVYRTTGAVRFHAAVRAGLSYSADTSTRRHIQPAPRRIKHTYTLHPRSSLNRAVLASK